jgi:hypothetical protein
VQEKLAVLGLLTGGVLVTDMVYKYGRNKSSIHGIRIRARGVCQAMALGAHVTAMVMS